MSPIDVRPGNVNDGNMEQARTQSAEVSTARLIAMAGCTVVAGLGTILLSYWAAWFLPAVVLVVGYVITIGFIARAIGRDWAWAAINWVGGGLVFAVTFIRTVLSTF